MTVVRPYVCRGCGNTVVVAVDDASKIIKERGAFYCARCVGNGWERDDKRRPCPRCHGAGTVPA